MTLLKLPGLSTPVSTQLIIWVQGDGNYSWVHQVDHPSHLVTQTLKWFEAQLSHFIRLNKSALVNPHHITLFKRLPARQGHILLSNGTALIVSRRRVNGVVSELTITL